MDMAYPCEKKQKVLPACVVKKNREVFPSEQYCGLKIYEKFNLYEICNKYNENTFAIYIFF